MPNSQRLRKRVQIASILASGNEIIEPLLVLPRVEVALRQLILFQRLAHPFHIVPAISLNESVIIRGLPVPILLVAKNPLQIRQPYPAGIEENSVFTEIIRYSRPAAGHLQIPVFGLG